ncbi:Conserved_hypothetical protein [Hexamita inflata]|uniref:Uncharacterized protein n=1 Tax=Hexamita inflata TaxID=28002 RepID=A0AA86N8E3_9EUKA|nr:Conserved hypothetical protein [Hexamita inflata]CAI9914755.1 Conserved hypothetical protein [Hexamita inflata]
MVNGSCTQVSCTVQGQQSINGICQCTNINSIVQSGSCECPINSNVIGTSCVCTISGQIMRNSQCICLTTGAFVNNNICTCGLNSLNISNTCSCPSGANLINGVCTCINMNAYISGNQCMCPTNSLLIGNTCTCPSSSELFNNECICNTISGQIMNSYGECECHTSGAFVNNGVCTCGLYALNISNICSCPVNSSLVLKACICDQIMGQQIINGTCQCPLGQSIVNNSCHETKYIINTSIFECSQNVYTSTFDIYSITNQVNDKSNFSTGYVFNTANIIQNAFIDISDNIYATYVQPLFQSQFTFINLKIQVGKQSLNSGSFILAFSASITINQMNIISRTDTQLLLNAVSQLNILSESLSDTYITNMLVNLSFTSSNGNITLVGIISQILSIKGYQVFGTYISTQTVAMISINIKTAKVNIDQVSIKPDTFNVGNCSSYLFSNAITSKSSFVVNNIAIILGNNSNYLLLGSITTSSWDKQYYLYGGIISLINTESTINCNNIILDSYQQFSSSYVSYSGFLVGYALSSSGSIAIMNVCLYQNIINVVVNYRNYGLIGQNNGDTSLYNASLTLSVLGVELYNFGIIGVQSSSIKTELENLRTSVSTNSSSTFGQNVGSMLGLEAARNCTIQNTSIIGGNIISGSYFVSGFIGYQDSSSNTTILNSTISDTVIFGSGAVSGFISSQCSTSNTTIQNSLISQTNISGSYYYLGGYIAIQDSSSNTTIIDSTITQTNISGQLYIGGLIGICSSTIFITNSKIQFLDIHGFGSHVSVAIGINQGGVLSFITSSSDNNYINGIKQNDCGIISNNWSVVGC